MKGPEFAVCSIETFSIDQDSHRQINLNNRPTSREQQTGTSSCARYPSKKLAIIVTRVRQTDWLTTTIG